MVSPIAAAIEKTTGAITSTIGHAFAPIAKAGGRALTVPGSSPGGRPEFKLPEPTTSIPAKIPGSKPGGRRGLQESFLSGVSGGAAARALPGQTSGWWGSGGGGGGRGGKTLVGQ